MNTPEQQRKILSVSTAKIICKGDFIMLNIAAVQGRLVADPELRHTPNGIAVTSFTIANDQGSGDNKQTSFIDVVAWRKTAEMVCKWFSKGSPIIVQGYIQTRSYTDRDGNKRKAVEIVADSVHFAESKRNDSPYQKSNDGGFEEIPDDNDLPF